jgi:poly-gamma-glutamate capsule biosynthesis protein CapA/YwtB (metallophosphatase superfamily)
MSRVVSVTVVLCDDVMTGRGIDPVLRTPSEPGLHEAHVRDACDYVRLAERADGTIGRSLADDAIWGAGLDHLRRLQPDLFVVNLETAVTTADQAWPGKAVHDRMHPANVGCLYAVTFDAGSGRVSALQIVPLQLRRFRLVDADAADRAWALGQFNAGSSRFGTRVVAEGTGRGALVSSLAPP